MGILVKNDFYCYLSIYLSAISSKVSGGPFRSSQVLVLRIVAQFHFMTNVFVQTAKIIHIFDMLSILGAMA